MKKSILRKGFTLVELVVVIGILTILGTFTMLNLTTLQNHTNLNTSVETMLSDIKQQQLKAMLGDTETRATSSKYGVYFDAVNKRYVLFHGNSYSSSEASNYPVQLDSGLAFSSVTLPNNVIIFDRVSGEYSAYVGGSNTVVLKDIVTNTTKTMTFNRYGVITQLN